MASPALTSHPGAPTHSLCDLAQVFPVPEPWTCDLPDTPSPDPADPREWGNHRERPGAKNSGPRGAIPGPCGRLRIPPEQGTRIPRTQLQAPVQVVHVSGPQSGTIRTPVSRVSWAWCRGTHTSDKPHPDLSARAHEAALSSQPFPHSLLSFLLQIPQGHLLAPALEHKPPNSERPGRQSFESSTEKGGSGEEEGAPALLWERGVPRALTPSPATG